MPNPPTTQKEIRERLALIIRQYVTPFLDATDNTGAVYSVAPMVLNHASLPSIVITDGTTNYQASPPRGRNMVIVNSTFNISLYNSEWQANTDNNINLSDIDTTIYELENLFFVRRSLEDNTNSALPFVEDMFLQSATPIEIRGYVPIAGALPSATQYVHKRLVLNIRYRRIV